MSNTITLMNCVNLLPRPGKRRRQSSLRETPLKKPCKDPASTPLRCTVDPRRNTQSAIEEVKEIIEIDDSDSDSDDNASDKQCKKCGLGRLSFDPVPVYCSGCDVQVKRNASYFTTSLDGNGTRHSFCSKCYKAVRGDSILLHGTGTVISKKKLEKKDHNERIEESWVRCVVCKNWQHQICALFNDKKKNADGQADFVCPNCCLYTSTHTSPLSAKDLPRTKLSNHIEQRLLRCLRQEKEDTARATGKSLDEVPGVEDLVVRVVVSTDKVLKVKQQFRDIFPPLGNLQMPYPSEFPYKSKAIVLFQKIDGQDVCIFAMYVQEYGTECCLPNHRSAYISYVDSVKYFSPDRQTAGGEALRTFVYHEILIGYLDYLKKHGFTSCHLWSCPPLEDQDFIFYRHPTTQKTPKKKKLCQWYMSMLKKAEQENIVLNVSNAYDDYFVSHGRNSKVTASQLPYFEGDWISGQIEKLLDEMEKESKICPAKRMKTSEVTKRLLKSMGQENLAGTASKDVLLMQKLDKRILEYNKENFIVIHLQYSCSVCHFPICCEWRWTCDQCKHFQLCQKCYRVESKRNGGDSHVLGNRRHHPLRRVDVETIPLFTGDDDDNIDNKLIESRYAFLSLCEENHYQFDTVRRAKYSTMMILRHLLNKSGGLAG